jgi:hypothetical protein
VCLAWVTWWLLLNATFDIHGVGASWANPIKCWKDVAEQREASASGQAQQDPARAQRDMLARLAVAIESKRPTALTAAA